MSAFDEYNDVKHAVINLAAAATTEVVAAVAGKIIEVVSLHLVAAGTQQVTFLSAATSLTGAMSMITGVPHTLPLNQAGCFKTARGEALNITLGQAVQTSGVIAYRLADV